MSLISMAPIMALPSELILHILSFLDIPELLNASRTARYLRRLCLDPILHATRLLRASLSLSRSIPCRPALAELVEHRIYITKTGFTAQVLSRGLINIRLNNFLLRRPTPQHLVQQGVLPRECLQPHIAPSLIPTKRRIEKEKVKDTLRHWIEDWRRKRDKAVARNVREQRPEVSVLVRKFARVEKGKDREVLGQRWDRPRREGERELPTRAKVLGLRRFWENLERASLST